MFTVEYLASHWSDRAIFGICLYWLWDHIFDFIGRQVEMISAVFTRLRCFFRLFLQSQPTRIPKSAGLSQCGEAKYLTKSESAAYCTGLTVRSKSGHLGSGEAWSKVPLSGSRVPENWSDPEITWAFFLSYIIFFSFKKSKEQNCCTNCH